MCDTCTRSHLHQDLFLCNALPIALYCLRLFVVVYKHLHNAFFEEQIASGNKLILVIH